MIDARRRVVVERVDPEVDCGRYPIKRVVGERVVVEADVFADGHDELTCVVLHRPQCEPRWCQAPMRLVVNDRWRGEFRVERLGCHLYTVQAWVDHFHSWSRDLLRRLEAGPDVEVELQSGAAPVQAAAQRAKGTDARAPRAAAAALTSRRGGQAAISPHLPAP